MTARIAAIWVMLLTASGGWAQGTNYPKAKVSFDDFKGLVAEVETHRASRLIDLKTFIKMSKRPGVIIFDSRSTFRFDRIHVKGAKHLAFTDFTQDNLQKVIPSFETTILIYCNNNFDGNQTDFASKVAMPRPSTGNTVATQFADQAKPLMMAPRGRTRAFLPSGVRQGTPVKKRQNTLSSNSRDRNAPFVAERLFNTSHAWEMQCASATIASMSFTLPYIVARMRPNNAFERSVGKRGPRLTAAWSSWPAAQLGR